VTSGLVDRTGGGDGVAVGVTVAVAVAVTVGVAVAVAVAVAVVLAAPPAGVVVVPPGDREVGVAEGRVSDGRDPEQAATDRDASMVKVAQPTTVSLAPGLVPAMVVRILWASSCVRKMAAAFSRSRSRKGIAGRPGGSRERRWP
jgi:hypothetical protein